MAFTLCWINFESIQSICQIDLLFSLESKNISSICIVNRTSYDTDRSWSRTIINENLYWTIVIFHFETPTTFFLFWIFLIFDCYLGDSDITFAYLQMLWSRGVPSNRCSFKLQNILRNPRKQKNRWKISLNDFIFNRNAILQHATLL